MLIKRTLFEGYMTVEGFKVDVQESDLLTKEIKGSTSVTISPEEMDHITKEWQKFRNGTNEKHCLIHRNYIDRSLDMPDMDYLKYIRMDQEEEKSKQ
jgi:hypothetical protein